MSSLPEFFHLKLTAHKDSEFCFLWSQDPEGMKAGTWKLSKGVPVEEEYPKDARFYMSDRTPGMELTSLIGGTGGYMVVERRLRESIERGYGDPSQLQCLPVSIYNHKKRLASADYFIINPLGSVDCLDLQRSEIEWLEGKVISVDRMVISAAKVKGVPPLFRVREDPRLIVMRDVLLDEWIDMTPEVTNIDLEQLQVVE